MHPSLTADHEAFRDSVRRFVREEITPFAAEWDEAETFPRGLYKRAAVAGFLGIGYPEECGGFEAGVFIRIIFSEELAACGAGGICASLMSHTIGAPPIAHFGSSEMKARVLTRRCRFPAAAASCVARAPSASTARSKS